MSNHIFRALAALLLLAQASAQAQVTLITDAGEFEARAGTTAVADFERVRKGQYEHIANGGLVLEAQARLVNVPWPSDSPRVDVIDELVLLPASHWFGDDAKGRQFVLTNTNAQRLQFAVDQIAFGFDAACFGCDPPDYTGAWAIELYDGDGRPVGQIEQVEPLSGRGSFVGILSPVPFRTAVVIRVASGNWLIDNIRQSAFRPLLVTNDLAEFDAIAGTTAIANLEDQPLGDVPVVQTTGLRLAHPADAASSFGLWVMEELVGLRAGFWFPAGRDNQRFLLINNDALMLSFASDQIGFALSAACLACDNPESPTTFSFELYDEAGELVGYQQQTREMSVHGNFYGVVSPRRFRHAILTRSNGGNWLIDDVRQSALARRARERDLR
ncbi:MAG: hypothetical protein R3F15_12125 [Lysobacterales bacterium]